MENKNRQAPSRIPVRFVDDEGKGGGAAPAGGEGAGELTPEEIGEQSIYEGETDAQRRIDRGREEDSEGGKERADDADAAGGPKTSDLPRHHNDLDTTEQHERGDNSASSASGSSSPREAGSASGPVMAELVATRAELKRVETELKKLADERHELNDRLARRQADFENYRKRTERERTEAYNRATGDVVGRLLPVLDNLRRALDAEGSFESGESAEFVHFLRGVELIEKQLAGVLEGLGVEPVPTVGQRFDPHIHEAVVTEETDEFEPDTVMEEMRRGYRLGDKLIRPAMVKVSK
jgi:molecular chaperone GrpE